LAISGSPAHATIRSRDFAFPLLNGVFDVCAGVAMLLFGLPIVWSLSVCGCGVALLVGTATLTSRDDLVVRPATIVFGIAAVLLLVLAFVYLTRDADSIPHLLPGYDADSERWRLLPGVLCLVSVAALIPATFASTAPN